MHAACSLLPPGGGRACLAAAHRTHSTRLYPSLPLPLTPTPTPALTLQGTTYKAAFSCDLVYQTEGMPEQRVQKRLGALPIMLKSKACYLRNMSRGDLVHRKVGGASHRL